MIVVSDNGPIAFLLQIEEIGLLPKLYGSVLIPPAVLEELRRLETPEIVRAWVRSVPEWLTVEAPLGRVDARRPGFGEREAIQLAREKGAQLLCDDRQAVNQARRANLTATGTLGILQAAHAKHLVEIEAAIQDLANRTEFYLTPARGARHDSPRRRRSSQSAGRIATTELI